MLMDASARPGTLTQPQGIEELPLTESQKGLLVVDSWVPTKQIYNQIMQFDINPSLPPERVAAALRVLVTVQPALRQVFRLQPYMHARLSPPPGPGDLVVEQIEAPSAGYREAVSGLAERLGAAPFDLAAGPAHRFGYVRATDGSAAAILLCAHHLVGDGVSMGPIVRDLVAALTDPPRADWVRARQAERESALRSELVAQNRASGSEKTAAMAQAWAQQLREVPPLVLDPRPNRPAETEFAGGRVDWMLDEEETARLHETCKRLAVTPFVLLTAIYGAVLARHGAVSRVLVGSPFVARRTVAAFDLCGFFVNTLPVTVDVDWEQTVDRHVEAVREAVDYCRSRIGVTFNQLVAQVQQDRTSNRNPLFSAMLAMQDTFDGDPAGAVRGVREPGNGTAKFDLWLGATRLGRRWLLELEYDRQLITPAAADGLLDSLRTALGRACADGDLTLAGLFADASLAASLRTDGYPAVVSVNTVVSADTVVSGNTVVSVNTVVSADTLVRWLAEAADQWPHAVAIEEPARRLTHRELADAAELGAGHLAWHGVGAGDIVGLAFEGLCDTVVAMLAILRRGATYLPLDPALPAERLEYMVERAGCRVVAGDGIDLPGVRTIGAAELARVGKAGPVRDGAAEPARDRAGPGPVSASHPPYLMFTSGSSGRPKGVLMGHGPLLNLTGWQIAALEQGPRTRFLQYAPLGFDVSFQEIVPTLAAGGTVVSRQPADRRDFPALARRVAEAEVTHIYLPVAALRPFIQAARGSRVRFPALRYLCVSGEQLLVDDDIRRFFVDHPHCALVNLYGPTETHAVTTHRLSGADPSWPAHVPIGLPIHGVTAYVMDATGHLAPTGVPGELYLGGRCPADGYVNDPEQTAARFLPDRFLPAGAQGMAGAWGAAARMYRTGDRVLRDERGTLIFLTREDNQIKIRGNRVELGEIEAVANGAPQVRQAVAVARGDGGDRELVLFVVAEDGPAVDHAELRTRLAAALPSYMVPTRIFDVDTVPTSATGKTDRAALAELATRLVAERAPAPAEHLDDLERDLVLLWSDILAVEGIDSEQSLLEYGAHSLNVFAAFAEIEQRYGVTVAVADFFRSPTVAALTALVRAEQQVAR